MLRAAMVRQIATALLAAACLAAAPGDEGVVTMDDGVRIRYRAVGERGPFIVIPVSVFTSPHFDELAATHRVVYYDPRGRGASDTGDFGALSLARNLEDLEALRRHLGADTMMLIGMSGLALELAAYALEHPGRVTHLVQLAPVPPRLSPHMDTRWNRMQARIDKKEMQRYEALEKSGKDPRAACVAFQRALAPSYSAAPERIDFKAICSHPNEQPAHQEKVWQAFEPSVAKVDLRPRLRELRMPRLVVYGERDLIPLEGVREWLVDGAPVKLLAVPGADHVPHIDRPDVVLPAIRKFLNGGEARPAGS
jgi:proline iminopeptidase